MPSRKTTAPANACNSAPAENEASTETSTAQFVVPEEWTGARLDVAVTRLLDFIPSRNFASKLLDAGLVQLNFKVCKPSVKVNTGDTLTVDLSFLRTQGEAPQAESIPLTILFEDADLLVINKPVGMVVHPGAGVFSGTLVNAVLGHCGVTLPSLGEPARAGIVHRLDRDTSGVMVVAKSQLALTELSRQFADHSQKRIYVALVYGVPAKSGHLETWHGRDPRNRIKYAVLPEGQGKKAILDYRFLETYADGLASRIECELYTGRTHQIRVQMTAIKHPLLGDALYGAPTGSVKNQKELWAGLQKLLTRQMLHARLLGFRHPRTGSEMIFECPPPADFVEVVAFLSQN